MVKKDAKVYIKRNNDTIIDGSANLPQPSAMEYGELAVNYHKGTLTFKNDANEMVKLEPLNVVQSTGSSTKDVMSQNSVTNALNGKQDKLVSGTNIKTINGASILGEGNITISVGPGGITDANKDGKTYGRKDGAWVEITSPDLSGYLTITSAANTYLSKDTASSIYATITTVNGKADKSTTLSGYGITDAKIENGKITLGSNSITPITAIPDEYITETELNGKGYLTSAQIDSVIESKGYLTTTVADDKYQPKGNYLTSIPIASTSVLGGIKVGKGLSIDSEGVLVSTSSGTGGSGVGEIDPDSGGTGEYFNNYENNKASGVFSHAEGCDTKATGFASHAEGDTTIASGDYAHAEGCDTTASGNQSHAECGRTIASGEYSHAEGETTVAYGHSAHSEGFHTRAIGNYSHTEGYATSANGYAQHVIGIYNTEVSSESGVTYAANSRAFIIGNGIYVPTEGGGGGNAGDAFYVRFNGETHADGAYSGSGADYAEMFEWSDGNLNDEDRIGKFVTLSNGKIRIANSSDTYILGVVSGSPMVIGDNPMRWQGKYLNDEWGRPLYENIEITEHIPMTPDEDGYDPNSKEPQLKPVQRIAYIRKLNPEWNGEQAYNLRTDRKEWACIGLLGKLLVAQDGTLKADTYCNVGGNGIATEAESGYYVIDVYNDAQALILFR